MLPKITLEQWHIFKTVVDEGSFAKAADVLNKSQSSVSYMLARMEDHLPTPVLTLRGRKAELTEAGGVLYRHATTLLAQAAEVEKTAAYLASGWEAEVVLAVDALAPINTLFCALHAFSQLSPATRVRMLETTLSGTDEALLLRHADIAITPRVPPGFIGTPLCQVSMIPVAAPDHPLFGIDRAITETELKQHRQIVLRDTGLKREQDAGWLGSEQRWTVTHPATSVAATKNGLGFAFLPDNRIAQELDSGVLRRLNLRGAGERIIALYLVLANQSTAGPATRAVEKELRNGFLQVSPR